MNSEGELINENNQVVCIFVNQNSRYAKLVNYFPEVYDAAQDLLKDLSSTKGLALKKVYDRICDFCDKAT